MIEIYVVRHGIAVAREGGVPDDLRTLTGKGRRRFRKTARAFARQGRKLDLILTSPLVRAVQTAEILAAGSKEAEVGVLKELDPTFGVGSLLEAVASRTNGSRSIALVGHEPQLSFLIGALAGVPAERLDLKKGAIVRLDARDLSEPGSAEARWSLKPRSKTPGKGLPLAKASDASAEEEIAQPKRKGRRRKPRRSERRRAARGDAESAANAETEPVETASETGPGDAVRGSETGGPRLDPLAGTSSRLPGSSDSPFEPA